MSATFDWNRDTGTATGSPAKGTTRSTGVTDVNHKSTDTYGTAYTAAPITDGTNSFEIWNFGKFSTGTFNQISAGLFTHTTTALGAGLTLKGAPACSGTSGLTYTTPSQTANANLTHDLTATEVIGSGVAVWFGATGPEATGKASSQDGSVDRYTNYLTTQLQVSGAVPGDTAQITYTLQYNEN
jgi:hypothetical protein